MSTSRHAAIVLALTDRFVPPAQALLESIRQHGGKLDGVAVVVLTTGLSASSLAALKDSAARAALPLDARLVTDMSDIGPVPDWAVSWCLRLYTGDVCAEFERALYLDSDMLVLSPLAPLLDVDLGDRTAAAVIGPPPFDAIRVAIPRSRRGEVDGNAPYFNAGVLLVDIARWRSRAVGLRSRAYLRQYPTTRIPDQDALNVVLVDDWVPLDKAWNTPAGSLDQAPMFSGLAHASRALTDVLRQWQDVQKRPKILHFIGHPKPWEPTYPWPELRDQYNTFVLPAFGSTWPASQPAVAPELASDRRRVGFPRV